MNLTTANPTTDHKLVKDRRLTLLRAEQIQHVFKAVGLQEQKIAKATRGSWHRY